MASRYWVGGTGTWTDVNTANWSATSGGAGGASVPSSADSVFFNASSGGGTVTFDGSAPSGFQSFDANGFTGTLTGSSPVIYIQPSAGVTGTLRFGSGMSFAAGSNFRWFVDAGSGATTTITTNGIAIYYIDVFNSKGTVAFVNATHKISYLTLSSGFGGSFTTNNANFTIGDNGTGTGSCTVSLGMRTSGMGGTLSLGTSTFTMNMDATQQYITLELTADNDLTTNNAKFVLNGNLAAPYGRATISDSYGTGSLFTFFNLEINDVNYSIDMPLYGTPITTLKISQTAAIATPIILYSSITIGSMTITSLNATSRFVVLCDYTNSPTTSHCTITATTKSLSNVDFFGITAAGAAAPFNGTGDWGANTNITFPSGVTRYAVGSSVQWNQTAMWSTSSGGASGASVPLPQDTPVFNGSSTGPYTIDLNYVGCVKALALSSYTGTFTVNNYRTVLLGLMVKDTITLGTSTTMAGTALSFLLYATDTVTTRYIDLKNKTISDLSIGNGLYALSSDYTGAGAVSAGTIAGPGWAPTASLDANGYNVTTATVVGPTANYTTSATVTFGSGTWTLTGTGTVFQFVSSTSNPVVLNPGTANIVLSYNGTSARTFYTVPVGGTSTAPVWNKITVGSGTGTGNVTFAGSGSISTLENTKTATYNLRFTAGTTTSIGKFNVKGSAGNLINLISTSSTLVFTLAKLGGGVIKDADYLNITRSTATPTTKTWYAGANSTNGGSNTGWIFKKAPSSGMFMLFY